ncbi:hypothetical protein HK096_003235 [Nowakowskiella sp. JEL0078]|nr:hypothetical protein HK096_003235 [Nowakowskiella sp. JEL0078]
MAHSEDEERDVNVEELTQPTGTITSSVINIANTMMGSGMLALPSAIAAIGFGLGIFVVGIAALAGQFGMYLLIEAASRVGRKSSFFSVSKITYPGAAIIFDSAIAIKCFGVSVSYLVIWGDLLPIVLAGLFPSIPKDSYILWKETWITIGLLLISPFAFFRRLDSLKYISALALSSVVYLIFLVVFYFIFPLEGMPSKVTWDEIQWIRFDITRFLTVLPIFVFAYTCHQNVFSVYNELIDNTKERAQSFIKISTATAFSTYELIGILGYITFGTSVSSNIIANYPNSALISGGQLAIAFLVLLSYPLQVHPARASLDKVVSQGAPVSLMSQTKFVTITLFLIVFSYVIAIKVHNLSTVLSIVGATGSTTIGYILPGVFYWRICEDEDIEAEDALDGVNHLANGTAQSNGSVVLKLDEEGLDPRDDSAVLIHAALDPTEQTPLLVGSSSGSTIPIVKIRKRSRARNSKWNFTKFGAVVLSALGVFIMISSISMQILGKKVGGHGEDISMLGMA